MSHLDPYTLHSETEVRCILDLQSIAQSIPDAFTDLPKATRSHIPAANAPARMDVLNVCRNTALEGWTVPEGGVAAPVKSRSWISLLQSMSLYY